jgi:hypothetical protein
MESLTPAKTSQESKDSITKRGRMNFSLPLNLHLRFQDRFRPEEAFSLRKPTLPAGKGHKR